MPVEPLFINLKGAAWFFKINRTPAAILGVNGNEIFIGIKTIVLMEEEVAAAVLREGGDQLRACLLYTSRRSTPVGKAVGTSSTKGAMNPMGISAASQKTQGMRIPAQLSSVMKRE